jgi:hypothetical protein
MQQNRRIFVRIEFLILDSVVIFNIGHPRRRPAVDCREEIN